MNMTNSGVVNMTNSMEQSSDANLESAGQAARPSLIDTILKDKKPLNDIAQSQPDEEDDDDYSDDEF